MILELVTVTEFFTRLCGNVLSMSAYINILFKSISDERELLLLNQNDTSMITQKKGP